MTASTATQAFETLDCMRVDFKTDRLNHRSRTALQRIGAVGRLSLRFGTRGGPAMLQASM